MKTKNYNTSLGLLNRKKVAENYIINYLSDKDCYIVSSDFKKCNCDIISRIRKNCFNIGYKINFFKKSTAKYIMNVDRTFFKEDGVLLIRPIASNVQLKHLIDHLNMYKLKIKRIIFGDKLCFNNETSIFNILTNIQNIDHVKIFPMLLVKNIIILICKTLFATILILLLIIKRITLKK